MASPKLMKPSKRDTRADSSREHAELVTRLFRDHNEALIRFLAERLGVPRAAVSLARGHAGRDKIVHVAGLPPEEVARRLGV